MTDWSPTGAPYAISARASSSAQLERAYRRLVLCYPKTFRRENTEEIIAVLLATARPGQPRPSLAETADLVRGAARMWLGLSRAPRTVRAAVRLMYAGALAEVAVIVTLLATAGSIESASRAAALRSVGPHASAALAKQTAAQVAGEVSLDLTAGVMIALGGIAVWLFLAWVNGKGSPYGRVGAIVCCAFYTATVALDLSQGVAKYAPAPVAAACAVAATGIAVNVLLIMKSSWPYYERQPAVAR
jgi:hypothetical protein